jgi:ABC-2 type transport system ATP-binding protein
MSIEVSSLEKRYGDQRAINNVSFSLKKGEIVGFLGPNGAGKSTTMKILTGFLPQSSGTAQVAGYDVRESPIQVKSAVGYLPENNPLYTDMYVKEYLTFVAGTYRVSAKRIEACITMTGLSSEKHKKISQLSKGFRQRVGLAAALLHDPEVLILDEPTTGLDPNQLVEIRQLIKTIGQEKTVLLSTHILQEVEQLCDRVIIINKGELVADKPIGELKTLRETAIITVTFGKAISLNQLKKVSGVTRVIALSETQFEVHTKTTSTTKEALFQFAIAQQTSILESVEKDQNLEDIFRQLTQ